MMLRSLKMSVPRFNSRLTCSRSCKHFLALRLALVSGRSAPVQIHAGDQADGRALGKRADWTSPRRRTSGRAAANAEQRRKSIGNKPLRHADVSSPRGPLDPAHTGAGDVELLEQFVRAALLGPEHLADGHCRTSSGGPRPTGSSLNGPTELFCRKGAVDHRLTSDAGRV